MAIDAKYRALVAAALFCLPAAPAPACRLALVLAMDISSSVDAGEDALQRGGLAAVLRDPEIRKAFLTEGEPVELAVFEWSGRYSQADILSWRRIESVADLDEAAAIIGNSVRSKADQPTAMGQALAHASDLLGQRPDCARHTIDVSGDGVNNEYLTPAQIYDSYPFQAVTVNGLLIDGGDYGDSPELLNFYTDHLRHGPGAFVEIAAGFDDFQRAFRIKLLRELQDRVIGSIRASGSRG